MELKVVIDKKYAFVIFGAVLILAGVIYSYAQPNIFGHSVGEIDVATDYSCANGKYVKSINLATGEVVCETDVFGTGEGSGGATIDYDDCSQIEFSTADGDNWLTHTCPNNMVLVGGAGCGGSYCGGLRYARCCRLNSGGGDDVGSVPEGTLCGASPWGDATHGYATDCQGTNPSSGNCPSGYSYKYIYMSSKAAFGTCVKN